MAGIQSKIYLFMTAEVYDYIKNRVDSEIRIFNQVVICVNAERISFRYSLKKYILSVDASCRGREVEIADCEGFELLGQKIPKIAEALKNVKDKCEADTGAKLVTPDKYYQGEPVQKPADGLGLGRGYPPRARVRAFRGRVRTQVPIHSEEEPRDTSQERPYRGRGVRGSRARGRGRGRGSAPVWDVVDDLE